MVAEESSLPGKDLNGFHRQSKISQAFESLVVKIGGWTVSVKKIGEVSFPGESPQSTIRLVLKPEKGLFFSSEDRGDFLVYYGAPKFRRLLPEPSDLTIEKIKDLAQTKPIPVNQAGDPLFAHWQCFFLFRNNIYRLDREYSPGETLLLIMDYEDKERRKFEQLKKKFELAKQVERKPRRESIPEEVRIAVWRRDGGKCARCGSREKLEYDHIIPVSKGGSNTIRNVELLCESCNRKKKDSII